MSRALFLADMMESTRQLSLWYLKKVPDERCKEIIKVGDVTLNHPYWTLGHLAWTDTFMCLKPLGSTFEVNPYINKFGIHTFPAEAYDVPIVELKEMVNRVYEAKLDFVRSLSDEILDGPFPLTMLKFNSTYQALMHNIRHEGIHAGQISVFCKVNKITTVKF